MHGGHPTSVGPMYNALSFLLQSYFTAIGKSVDKRINKSVRLMKQNRIRDDKATIFHLVQSSPADSFDGDMCGSWYSERFHIFMNGTSSIQHSTSSIQRSTFWTSSIQRATQAGHVNKIGSKVDQTWINRVILIHSCA